MSMFKQLASSLAKAKTLGRNDGDFFNPNQQGTFVINELIHNVNGVKQSVILTGTILESNAKTADAKVQAAGTKVKKIYALSKRDWAMDELKTDLLAIAGVDEKTVSPAELEEMFGQAFDPEQRVLEGVAVNFNTSVKEREGKQTLTKIYFSEAKGDINGQEQLSKRRAEIVASRVKKAA